MTRSLSLFPEPLSCRGFALLFKQKHKIIDKIASIDGLGLRFRLFSDYLPSPSEANNAQHTESIPSSPPPKTRQTIGKHHRISNRMNRASLDLITETLISSLYISKRNFKHSNCYLSRVPFVTEKRDFRVPGQSSKIQDGGSVSKD